MDQRRFENAIALRDAGRVEDALLEFRALAEEASEINEQASLLLNVHTCFCLLDRIEDATRTLNIIHELEVDDPVVSMNVIFGKACMLAQDGKPKEAALCFEQMLKQYAELLKGTEFRDLYQDVQQRLAFALIDLGRHGDAVHILEETIHFKIPRPEDQQRIHLYLGICYGELTRNDLAKEELLRVISLGPQNDLEVQARYRLARLYFDVGAFAQAKHHLETIIQTQTNEIAGVPPNYIYEQLARVCHYLGEEEAESRYIKL